MLLRSLTIKNYRSLEEVRLDKLERFNVLIGRNNSGKSSVFGALQLLSKRVREGALDVQRVLTDMDQTRSLELVLTFRPEQKDREEYVDIVSTTEGQKSRRAEILRSSLLREVEFTFKAPEGQPGFLHLRQTKIRTEDNQWAVVQTTQGNESTVNPMSFLTNTAGYAGPFPGAVSLNQTVLDVETVRSGPLKLIEEQDIGAVMASVAQGNNSSLYPAITWPQAKLAEYLGDAFFFDPFRHSEENEGAQQLSEFAQDGSNLARILFTLHNNNAPKFEEIESFVQSALPDVGTLETPVENTSTRVSFRRPEGYMVRLHDMGGGIEQLLMAATVLQTTGDESTLFLEEPESHLHAGAQRYLIEQLYSGDRQVFVATHSPTFVNLSRPRSLFQVTYVEGRTEISRMSNADSLGAMLEDIGARNSDVLLSDAVLFVEGPSDRDVLYAWSEILGTTLEGSNVTVLPMGGGTFAERKARVRSEILEGISEGTPVPHLFVLDSDERSPTEIEKLQRDLGENVILLERREIENYLTIPRALLNAIENKHRDDSSIVERIGETSIDDVQSLINTTVEGLYGVVLLKRIRARLEGFKGGLLPVEVATSLAPEAKRKDLARRLRGRIRARVKEHIADLDIDACVRSEREALDAEWSDQQRRLELAPGEEVLKAVFDHFGSVYKKPKDTVRVAKMMDAQEIPSEVQGLISETISLADKNRTSFR